jgi:hypothetical protein
MSRSCREVSYISAGPEQTADLCRLCDEYFSQFPDLRSSKRWILRNVRLGTKAESELIEYHDFALKQIINNRNFLATENLPVVCAPHPQTQEYLMEGVRKTKCGIWIIPKKTPVCTSTQHSSKIISRRLRLLVYVAICQEMVQSASVDRV